VGDRAEEATGSVAGDGTAYWVLTSRDERPFDLVPAGTEDFTMTRPSRRSIRAGTAQR